MLTTQIVTAGNLAEEPKLAWSAKGTAVLTLTVLVNHGRYDDNRNWIESLPTRHLVKAFGRLAENVADSLSTGDRVVIVGAQRAEEWHDRVTKERRITVWVHADEIGASLGYAIAKPERTGRQTAHIPADTEVPALASVA